MEVLTLCEAELFGAPIRAPPAAQAPRAELPPTAGCAVRRAGWGTTLPDDESSLTVAVFPRSSRSACESHNHMIHRIIFAFRKFRFSEKIGKEIRGIEL